MTIFQSVRTFYSTIGICPTQSSENVSIDLKRAFFLFSSIPLTISLAGYFLFQASTTIEHTQTFYVFLFHVACILNYVISYLKLAKIFKFMDNVGETIQKSENNVENIT